MERDRLSQKLETHRLHTSLFTYWRSKTKILADEAPVSIPPARGQPCSRRPMRRLRPCRPPIKKRASRVSLCHLKDGTDQGQELEKPTSTPIAGGSGRYDKGRREENRTWLRRFRALSLVVLTCRSDASNRIAIRNEPSSRVFTIDTGTTRKARAKAARTAAATIQDRRADEVTGGRQTERTNKAAESHNDSGSGRCDGNRQ